MKQGPIRLAVLSAALAFGATGLALALTGAGLPFLGAAALSGVAAGVVQYAALVRAWRPDRRAEDEARQDLERFRTETATLRHDLRGVLSPALMMSDRLLQHADPAVQRAGQAVVRSIERATALLSTNREVLSGGVALPPAAERGAGPAA